LYRGLFWSWLLLWWGVGYSDAVDVARLLDYRVVVLRRVAMLEYVLREAVGSLNIGYA
jgi:hypothetical protein